MPQRNPGGLRLRRLILFSLACWTLVALGRAPRPTRVEPALPAELDDTTTAPAPVLRRRRRTASPRRLAMSFAVAVLFFAGASFSAIAGDRAVSLLGEDGDAAAVEASDAAAGAPSDESASPETEAVPAEPAPEPPALEEPAAPAEPAPAPAEPAPAETEPAPAPAAPEPQAAPAVEEEAPAPASFGHEATAAPDSAPATEAVDAPAPEPVAAPVRSAAAKASKPAARSESRAVVQAKPRPAKAAAKRRPLLPAPSARPTPLDPEASSPGFDATIWLHRTLPDPTPQSLRLTPEYASRLVRLSRQSGADWALVLGVLRSQSSSQAPARPATIADTADRLVDRGARRNAWTAALAVTGRTAASDRAVALARYYRAIGIRGLVRGLQAEQDRLVADLLTNEHVWIYPGGRVDLAEGRVDVRVVALLSYLGEAFGEVTISSLISGHRIYSRPGVVSAHVYGAAVDIAALGGTSILGHQQPGSVTEQAVRAILLLPAEMRPRQVISLIGMGGPSFALADHHDHIHVGY